MSLLRKGNLAENRTLSEIEVSLLTGVYILRLSVLYSLQMADRSKFINRFFNRI